MLRTSLLLTSMLAALVGCRSTSVPQNKGKERTAVRSETSPFSAFNTKLRALVRKHYPSATYTSTDRDIHFEHDTKTFVLQEPLKTGKLQPPRDVEGPDKGGIWADIKRVKGKYRGAAMLPQSFDKGPFTVHVFAPHCAREDEHLHVRVKVPPIAPEGFLRELRALLLAYSGQASRVSVQSGRQAVTVNLPQQLKVIKTQAGVEVTMDKPSSVSIKVTNGRLLGYKQELFVVIGKTSTSLRHGYSSSPDFGTSILNRDAHDFLRSKQPYTIQMTVTVFETAVPPGHRWSPQSAGYREILKKTHRASMGGSGNADEP